MHTLHTTDSFVIGSTPHGESNRVYSLFTRDLGFLYAHGQGVRQLHSKNRFALRTGSLSLVTLVRGREVWRITGAQVYTSASGIESGEQIPPSSTSARERRVLALLQSFAPREEPLPHLFFTLHAARDAFTTRHDTHGSTIEMLAALRTLHALGYVAPPSGPDWPEELISPDFSDDVLHRAEAHTQRIITLINNALSSAST